MSKTLEENLKGLLRFLNTSTDTFDPMMVEMMVKDHLEGDGTDHDYLRLEGEDIDGIVALYLSTMASQDK